MKLAIMQPYFMPYIGYFQAIKAVDKYILYSNLTFIKEAWMNRNRVRLKDGRTCYILVPLVHKSSNALISETMIDNTKHWRKDLLNTIYFGYKKSECFDEVYPLMEELLSVEADRLADLNSLTIKGIAAYLDITTEIESDNTRYLELEDRLNTIENGYASFPYMEKTKPIKKVARVLEICRCEGCDFFVNAIGGRELYSKDEFSEYGISLNFVQTNEITYPQYGYECDPKLSIIDVLMHNGKEGTKKLLDEYTLV